MGGDGRQHQRHDHVEHRPGRHPRPPPRAGPAKKPGRPIDFGAEQQQRYRGRNVVERCFNKLKQWRGIAMRTDKLARNYRAAIALAATLIWLRST